jgi:hypothetical protein
MEWQPWYTYVIIAIIIAIIKSFQQTTEKKYTINNDTTDDDKTINNNILNDLKSISQTEVEISVNEKILKLIEEMGYILISNNININLDYETTFVNYKKKFFDFKRQPTNIKLSGNDKSKNVKYTSWSDRYEYGQNSHNDDIAKGFLKTLTEKLK